MRWNKIKQYELANGFRGYWNNLLRLLYVTLILTIILSVTLIACRSDLDLAQECYRIGDYQRAKKLYENELDKHPSSFETRYGYAVVLQEISLREKSNGEDKAENWLAVVREYEICSKLGDADSFSENFALALFHLGNKLYLEGRFAPAQDYLDHARKLEPKNTFVVNLAGIVEYSQGKYKEAKETFEFLLAFDPSFVTAYLNLGNVLWESGEEDAALVTWKQALNISPGNPAVVKRIEMALANLSEEN